MSCSDDYINRILCGDALSRLDDLPDESIDVVLTSPPYWSLRKYNVSTKWPDGWKGELGLEPTFKQYIEHLLQIFDKVKRVLKKTGSMFIVLSDTYGGVKVGNTYGIFKNGVKHPKTRRKDGMESHVDFKKDTSALVPQKSLCLIPQRFQIAMSDHGWILRQIPIWHKRNCMPSSVRDRWTIDYEQISFFTKSQKYYFKTQYEPYSEATMKEYGQVYNGKGLKDYEKAGVQNPSDVKRRIIASLPKKPPIGGIKHIGRNFRDFDRTYSGNTEWWNGKGRIARAVWSINTQPSPLKHYAIFPEALVAKIIKAACPSNGVVLDPFAGVGTTALVALKMNRNFVMIEPSEEYIGYARQRLDKYLNQEKILVENT